MPQVKHSPREIANMPPHEMSKHMQGLHPAEAAQVAHELNNNRIRDNRTFMRKSLEKWAYCPVAGGSGTSANFVQGTTLVFDLPVVGSGFAKGLLVTYNLTITLASGSSAQYAVNAAAPWNIFSEVDLLYNGPQIRTHPYIFKLLDQTKGYLRGQRNQVLAGVNDATIASNIVGTVPTAVGANTWQGKIWIPFNALGTDSVPGLLPVMGVGNKPQLKLQCSNALLGVDPLLNAIAATTGTGQAVSSVTGTINVDMQYLDGTSMDTPVPLTLNLAGEPTLQYYWDTPLNPLNANLVQRQHIATLLEHWYAFAIVIDGNQSNQFTALSNLTNFELSPDSVGQQTFYNYNVANNISIYDYYNGIRRRFGQDLDNGVIAWVTAPNSNVIDSSNRNGNQVLNMRPGGFPAATHGYQVATTGGVAGITPRVEMLLVSMNYDGLRIS